MKYEERFFISLIRVWLLAVTRNEEKPDLREVKLKEGIRKKQNEVGRI